MSLEEERARLLAAQHAMMAGVGYMIQYDNAEGDLKHIRTGINTALANCGVIAKLLIDKGIITEEEYFKELADAMERERDSYRKNLETYLRKKHGNPNLKIELI
jgi:hypothetical protein